MTASELLSIARTPSFGDESLRAAILSYGRSERERAAKVCDSLVYAIDHGGNKYSRPAPADRCAAYIRSLPDEPTQDQENKCRA